MHSEKGSRRCSHASTGLCGLAAIAVFLLPQTSRAELWQGADTLGAKRVSFGAFAEVFGPSYSRPTSFMLNGQFAYGTGDRTDAEVLLGLGMLDTDIAFYGKYLLIREVDTEGDHWSGAIRAGFRDQVGLSAEAFLVVSRTAHAWEAYVSPYFSAPIISSSATTPWSFGLIPGLSLGLGEHSRFYFEANLNLGASYNAASFGIKESF